MTRLTIPEPDITLYEDGFAGRDLLDRKATGDALSDLVDRISEPMVIALDGGWGSGKSFFLRCWVGEHLKRADNTTQTVYFDAFANDFMDEPLVSLMACLLERFEELGPQEKSKLDKAKNIAWKLGPAGLRIAASLATFGATNHLDELGDVAVEALGKEIGKSSDSFWRKAQERQGVMEQFREALGALTVGDEGEPRKLVIVVDELDRCRPDYALALLEIIKHFFAVDHVHFVLGVNLRELENSVKARYGGEISAGLYLQKFVTLTMGLPDSVDDYDHSSIAIRYFQIRSKDAGIASNQHQLIMDLILSYKDKSSVTLRAIQRLIAVLQVSSIPDESNIREEQVVLTSLAILKAWNLRSYKIAKTGQITLVDLEKIFIMNNNLTGVRNEQGRFAFEHFECWQYYLDPSEHLKMQNNLLGLAAPAKEDRIRILQSNVSKRLEVFRLPSEPPT
ncbi:MAG: P-loop NTPase fold protein [Sulfitobacter sp.]